VFLFFCKKFSVGRDFFSLTNAKYYTTNKTILKDAKDPILGP